MAGISYTMATEIAINTVSAQKSIKGLNSALSSAVNSMKAGVAQANSVGDSLGAMQAKVSGLDQVMSQLQGRIDALKDKQSGLDVKTKEGAESYLKLQKQIEQSENRLASYSAQQDRAKESMTYYSSGLADLQRGYQTTIEKTDAYSNRLKAEGDELGANKAKLSGYKEALANLNSQYEKQNAELQNNQAKVKELSTSYNEAKSKLDELKTAGNTNSDAYKDQVQQVDKLRLALGRANESLDTQKIRIDKTGTSIAETKTKTAELSSQIDKEAPQGFFKSMINGFHKTSDESERTKSKVGGVLSYFAGGALLNGVTTLTSGLQNQVKAGYEDAKAVETFQDKFKNMGASVAETNKLGLSINSIKENSNISGSAITALTQKFYGMTGSVQKTQKLTKGVGSLSDALHLSEKQSDAFTNGLSRIESSGKVTSLSLGRLERQAPGLGSAMAKASGMSRKSFNDLVNSGKMTSSQFNDILTKASGSFDKNAKEFNSTTDGATHHMQVSWADTRKSLMKPLVKVSSSGLSELSKILDNKQTQNAAGQLGSAIGQVANACSKVVAIMSGSTGHIISIIESVTKITILLASGIWDTFVSVGKTIANVFESIFGKSKKSIGPLGFIAKGLKEIASNKTAVKTVGSVIGGIVAPILAVKGAILAYSVVAKALTAIQTALNIVMSANPYVIIGLAIAGVIAGFVELYKHSKVARDIMNSVGKVIKKVFTGVIDFFKNNWKQIGLFILNPFVGIATLLYKNVKPFRNFVNTVSKTIKSGFNAIGKFFVSFFSSIGKLFSSSLKFIGRLWFNEWNAELNGVKVIWGFISNLASGFWNGIKNIFNSSLRFISSVWNGTWNGIFSFGKGIWNGITNVINGFTGGIKNIWNDVTSFVGRMWSGMWNGVINAAKSAVSTVGHVVAKIANGVIRPIDSMLGKLKDGINWILDKVGAHKIGGFHIPLVSYANGTKDTHQGGLAMVNDAPGSNFREMYQLPDGQVGMFPNKRNMIIPLPKGTSVLDGERSAAMAKMMGLPAYKNGIGNFFGGLWNGAKDIFSDVENILKHPVEFTESVFNHFLGGFSSNIKLASSIITSFPKKLAAESISWVKKQFESMEAPAGSGAARWHDVIKRALAMDGASTSEAMIQKWIRQVNTESGGNEKAIGGNDGLADGNAMGLVQVKPGTFNANKFPGHNNPLNGFDSLLAGIKYAMKRYGASMGFIGHGHGYENGGFINRHQMIEVGEHNMNEVVIPLDSSKRSRTTELMHQVLDMLAGNSDVNLDTKFNSKQDVEVAALINEVSDLKNMVKDLVNLQIETIKSQNGTTNAVINTAQSPQDRYKQDAQNGQLLGYQKLNGGIA